MISLLRAPIVPGSSNSTVAVTHTARRTVLEVSPLWAREDTATLGSMGSAPDSESPAVRPVRAGLLGRLISLALRSGITLRDVSTQLRGISCDRAVGLGPNKVLSVPDAIAQVLIQHQAEKEGVQQELPITGRVPAATQGPAIQAQAENQSEMFGYDPGETFIGTCPECSAGLHFMEGCVKCLACGYSECG